MAINKYFSVGEYFMSRINPFSFNLPVQPPEFVGRHREISIFENFLQNTIDGFPKNYIISGPRGIGKTSLLDKFVEIARKQGALVIKFPTSSSPVGRIASLSELNRTILLELYTEIDTQSRLGFIKAKSATEARKAIEENLKRCADFGRPKQIEIPFFVDALLRVWQNLSESFKAVVLMIDEAERLESIPNCLDYLRETFIRIETLKAKYMLTFAGKMTFPNKTAEMASPIMRFFHTETLENLSEEELNKFIEFKTNGTGVVINIEVKKKLYAETEGHPYFAVTYLYVLFQKLPDEKNEIDLNHYNACMPEINKFLAKEYFDDLFYRSSKQAKEILVAIAKNKEIILELSTLREMLKKEANKISPYLGELSSTGILTRIAHGTYKVFHPLFLSYLIEEEKNGRLLIIKPIRKKVFPISKGNKSLFDNY